MTGSMGGGDRTAISMRIRSRNGQGFQPADSTEDIFNIVKTETYEVTTESVNTQGRGSSTTIGEDK